MENKTNDKLKQFVGSATGGGEIKDSFFHLHLEQMSPLKGKEFSPVQGHRPLLKGYNSQQVMEDMAD